MQKLAFDEFLTDELKILEDSECCLKVQAVISRAGVYDYPEGRALKSKMELLRASRAARFSGAALYVADQHPDSLLVTNPDDVHGGIEKPFFDRDRIRAVLNFDKKKCSNEFLTKVRSGKPLDVSIGFHYRQDWTPGIDVDVNTGAKKPYDFVMRDIKIDHVACGVIKGRCSYPRCGIGLDSLMETAKIEADKVEQRGNQWCVIHCHGPNAGEAIKCFPTQAQAEAMHRAIQAQKAASATGKYSLLNWTRLYADEAMWKLIVGDNGRPPKDWWDSCNQKAQSFADDPAAFCGWLYAHGPANLRSSMGASSVSGNKNMSQPDGKKTDQESPYDACIKEKTESGMNPAEAAEACKDLKPAEDQKPPTETPPPPQAPESMSDAATILSNLDKKLELKKHLKLA